MASVSKDAREKPSGWLLDVVTTSPPSLLGGERNLVIFGGAAAAFFAFEVAPHVNGSILGFPPFLVVIAGSIAFYLVWHALVCVSWRIDPWMSKTLSRFLHYPESISAHATGAVSQTKRTIERQRKHLKR